MGVRRKREEGVVVCGRVVSVGRAAQGFSTRKRRFKKRERKQKNRKAGVNC